MPRVGVGLSLGVGVRVVWVMGVSVRRVGAKGVGVRRQKYKIILYSHGFGINIFL